MKKVPGAGAGQKRTGSATLLRRQHTVKKISVFNLSPSCRWRTPATPSTCEAPRSPRAISPTYSTGRTSRPLLIRTSSKMKPSDLASLSQQNGRCLCGILTGITVVRFNFYWPYGTPNGQRNNGTLALKVCNVKYCVQPFY